MNPLLQLAIQIIPGLIQVFAGDKTGSAAVQVADAIKKVTQTENPDEAKQKLETDPIARAQLQKALSEIALEELKEQNRAEAEQRTIELSFYREELADADRQRQAEMERFKARLGDVAAARTAYAETSKQGGLRGWIVPIIAILVTIGLFYFLYRLIGLREPLENRDVFNTILGALTTAFITIITFFFGSSQGSREKDDMISAGQLVSKGRDGPVRPTQAPLSDGGPSTPAGTGAIQKSKSPVPDGPFGLFRQKAPRVMAQLVQDFGLTKEQAAGILGNIGHECAGFRKLQEQNPIRGGRGGWGWCQWTGPRRVQFEDWAGAHNLDFTSDEANYGFLKQELTGGPESGVVRSLRRADNVEDATATFMREFERPAPQFAGLDSRRKWARMALQEFADG